MPSRYICSVLEEMRECHKHRNFSYLPGLIEEAQTMANRMECGLQDRSSLRYVQKEAKKLRREVKRLEKRKARLEATLTD